MRLHPRYGVDMPKRWRQLVSEGKIQTVCSVVGSITGKEEKIRFGLRLDDNRSIVPFCINEETGIFINSVESSAEVAVEDEWDISTCPLLLRPILNYRKLYTSTDISIVQIPSREVIPLIKRVHNFPTCSMCSGPFSLFQREPLGTIRCQKSQREWEIHWNIAPQDYRGHFLFIPKISLTINQRPQFIINEDIEDIIELIRSDKGPDNGFIGYNSIGAGASQNHIHFQAYSSPSPLFSYPFQMITHSASQYKVGSVEVHVRAGYHNSDECKCSVIHVLWEDKTSNNELIRILGHLLASMEQEKVPFNVLFGSKSVFIIPRRYNASQIYPYLGLGMLEYSGTFVYQDEIHRKELSKSLLCNTLSSASLSAKEIASILHAKWPP